MTSKWTVLGALSLSSLVMGPLGLAAAQEAGETGVLIQVEPLSNDADAAPSKAVWFQSADDEAEAPDAVEFSADHWLYLLSDADLDVRMQNFERIIEVARGNSEALEWLQARASATVDPELAWTAKLALREVKRRGLFRFQPNSNIGGLFQIDPRAARPLGGDPFQVFGQGGGVTSQSKSVQIQSGPNGVKVVVKELVDGEQKSTEYEAEDMQALIAAHPELEELMGSGMGGGFRIGLSGEDSIIDLDGLRLEFDQDLDNLMPPGGLRRIFRAIPHDLNLDQDPLLHQKRQVLGELRTDVLGVYVAQATPAQLEALGRNLDAGIYVEAIAPGTLAEKLGITAGDFLIKINGTVLKNGDMIGAAMRARAKGADLVVEGMGIDGKPWTKTWSPPVPTPQPR